MRIESSGTRAGIRRRTFLHGAAVAATVGAVAGSARPAAAAGEVDLAAWFENVPNFDGVRDLRDEERVGVSVGAGGGFTFGPAAVRVDPGTTVVWEWTGEGGSHNVVDKDGAYESEMVGNAGHTFEHTFEREGVSRYACAPHEAMGMKGAIVVGDVAVRTEATPTPEPTPEPPGMVEREPHYGNWFDGVDGFEGTVDMRRHSTVTVRVTDDGFSPAAVHVDPGTTVVWEWAGGETSHQITAIPEAGNAEYESALQSTGRYAVEFDGVGVSKYGCTQHDLPMRGAVVVGDVFDGVGVVDATEQTVLGLFAVGILSPTLFAGYLWLKRRGGDSEGEA